MADIRNYNTTASSNTDIAPEGMAPSGVNDAIRAVQGELAQIITDEGGTITTGGTATAYTITLNTSPSALADGLYFSFTAGTTNTGAATLAVTPNGGGAFAAKSIRKFADGAEADLVAGEIVSGGRYIVQYEASANGGAGAYILLNPSRDSAAWTSVSVGASSGSGTLGSASGTRRHKKIGRTVFVEFSVTIANVGTAGAGIALDLPYPAAGNFAFAGRENAISGNALSCMVASGSSQLFVFKYDNTFPTGNGGNLVASGVYEATS